MTLKFQLKQYYSSNYSSSIEDIQIKTKKKKKKTD